MFIDENGEKNKQKQQQYIETVVSRKKYIRVTLKNKLSAHKANHYTEFLFNSLIS